MLVLTSGSYGARLLSAAGSQLGVGSLPINMESTLGSGSSCLSGKGHGFFCPMQDTSGRNSTFCHWGILFFFLIELSVLFAVVMSAVCLYCVRCAGLFSLLKT